MSLNLAPKDPALSLADVYVRFGGNSTTYTIHIYSMSVPTTDELPILELVRESTIASPPSECDHVPLDCDLALFTDASHPTTPVEIMPPISPINASYWPCGVLPAVLMPFTSEGCARCENKNECSHYMSAAALEQELNDIGSKFNDLLFINSRRVFLQDQFFITKSQALELYITYLECGKDMILAVSNFDPELCAALIPLDE